MAGREKSGHVHVICIALHTSLPSFFEHGITRVGACKGLVSLLGVIASYLGAMEPKKLVSATAVSELIDGTEGPELTGGTRKPELIGSTVHRNSPVSP